MDPDPGLRGARVLVAGAGISGLAAAAALVEAGAEVTMTDAVAARLDDLPPGVAAGPDPDAVPPGTTLVVTGPGRRPDHPLVAAAAAAGVEMIGEPELAWRMGRARAEPPVWLAVTGTNGKTTTVGMLATILRAAGCDAVACGNNGHPVVDAVRDGHRVLAVELSSFQLHWSPSIRPAAGCVLNVADDHLDWHGSLAAYAAAKARALLGPVAVAGVDDAAAAALLAASPAAVRVGRHAGRARRRTARHQRRRARRPRVRGRPPGAARRRGVRAPRWPARARRRAGRRRAGPGLRRRRRRGAGGAGRLPAGPAPLGACRHGRRGALRRRLQGHQPARGGRVAGGARRGAGRIVWIVGGLLKGASVDEVAARYGARLRAAVVIGTDRGEIVRALARHAPKIPVAEVAAGDDGPMTSAVRRAAALARPGDVVLLAPAAASMDQFVDYAHRGRAFADAVADLAAGSPG